MVHSINIVIRYALPCLLGRFASDFLAPCVRDIAGSITALDAIIVNVKSNIKTWGIHEPFVVSSKSHTLFAPNG